MGSIYTEGPHLFGCQSNLIEVFSIGQSNDMDVWPEITLLGVEGSNRPYASCGGRVRTPFIGGGGSYKMYFALRRLMWIMQQEQARVGLGQQGDLFGAYPLRPRKYIERHMDDGHGYFGIEIQSGGIVRIRMRPRDDEEYPLSSDVEVFLRPETPFQMTYTFMPKLWKAIARDNKKLGSFGGNHAW